MPLSRLLYYSENQLNPKNGSMLQQLSELMIVSRRNNEKRDITGALIFDPLWFFQCLEGERNTVLSVFEFLRDDERHSNVRLVALEDIAERSFGHWWMGLILNDEHTAPAFAPFLRRGRLRPDEMSGKEIFNLIREVSRCARDHSSRSML